MIVTAAATTSAPAPTSSQRGRFEGLDARVVLCTIQGWLRTLAPDGRVMPALSDLVVRPPSNLNVVVFSELDHPDAVGGVTRDGQVGRHRER